MSLNLTQWSFNESTGGFDGWQMQAWIILGHNVRSLIKSWSLCIQWEETQRNEVSLKSIIKNRTGYNSSLGPTMHNFHEREVVHPIGGGPGEYTAHSHCYHVKYSSQAEVGGGPFAGLSPWSYVLLVTERQECFGFNSCKMRRFMYIYNTYILYVTICIYCILRGLDVVILT